MMKELMMNEDFSDVTLITEDKKHIKANINILSACSPVFKDIFKKEKNSSPIMYLRGIQYAEMESIMQFIYLGKATFHEERMDEFLAVSKSLEIKELCNAEAESESHKEPDDEPLPSNPDTSDEEVENQTVKSDDVQQEVSQRRVDIVSDTFECGPCHKTYTTKMGLFYHKQSVHEGVKYACEHCDFQSTQQSHLKAHIQSKHKGFKYACDQCDYQGTRQSHLTEHIQSKHEGFKYACDQCDYTAAWQTSLRTHKKNIHQ